MTPLTEPVPPRGTPIAGPQGVLRLVAGNPGPFTYHGTNTWLVPHPRGFAVIDPGLNDPAHRAAILAATGGRITAILLTHHHRDHAEGAPALAAASGAPIHAPDAVAPSPLAGLTAFATPGHTQDHVCFLWQGLAFTGDHVMGWSTSVIIPPDGDMRAYLLSLDRLEAAHPAALLPGHGPIVPNPAACIAGLRQRRRAREASILAALATPATPNALAAALYPGLDPALSAAAARTVLAHLLKLRHEGRAQPLDASDGAPWQRTA